MLKCLGAIALGATALGATALGATALVATVFLGGTALAASETRFMEVSEELGVDFVHRHFGSGQKYMPENMGAGVVVFDADGDGRLDLYFLQGSPLGSSGPRQAGPRQAQNRLFRQTADGVFDDVTASAGVGDTGYGMGASFGDIDADGDLDLYVTNFGRNVLYRNLGDGSFEDVTAMSGVGCELWSTGSSFFDADRDGDLDLYVVNYIDFSFAKHKFCGNAQTGLRSYCHPDVYDGVGDVLYRNDGTGRFTDISQTAGIRSTAKDKGLGIAVADLDIDGLLDIYVANDSTLNYLYLADGHGGFREEALLAGVGANGSGQAEASMGVEIGDVDGDGRPEIFLTHLDQETNTLYRNRGERLWRDGTRAAGLGDPSLPWVGFGTVLFDHDNDGDLDLLVLNGHIIDNIALFDASRSHRQPAQLFDNNGDGRFEEVSTRLGLAAGLVGRGAVGADLDRDGDVDLVLTQNGGRAIVLRNESGNPNASLSVRLEGRESNRSGFGARLVLEVEGHHSVRWLKSSTSYLSQGPPQAHFGLASAKEATMLGVYWPSGRVDRHGPLAVGYAYTLVEGESERASRAFVPVRD